LLVHKEFIFVRFPLVDQRVHLFELGEASLIVRLVDVHLFLLLLVGGTQDNVFFHWILKQQRVIIVVLNVNAGARKDEEAATFDSVQERHDELFVHGDGLMLTLDEGARGHINLILNLIEFFQLGLHKFEGLHLISNEIAVTIWHHSEEDSLEIEALGPFLANRRWEFRLQVLELVCQMVNFLIYHILLLGSLVVQVPLACAHLGIHFLFIHLFCLNVLEKLLDFGHLEVIIAYRPN
jgi:hypothetical protein